MNAESPEPFYLHCFPCDQDLSFPPDGVAARFHASRHGLALTYSDDEGYHIGSRPDSEALTVQTREDILDWHDQWASAPDEVWSAATRLAIIGQDTRTTIKYSKGESK